MLSAKTKGLFVEASRFGLTVAQTSASQAPLVVEQVVCVSPDLGREKVKELVLGLCGARGARFAQCNVSVYPQSRFLNRHSVDTPAKLKEQNYFEDIIRNQMGVDLSLNMASVVNACDGMPFDSSRSLASQKELLVCGATMKELREKQEELQGMGVYPTRMELGSLAMLGAITSVARFNALKRPVLLLEIGTTSTYVYIVSPDRVELCRQVPAGLDSMLPILAGELGMKDEQAARSMLYSNTFDFTEMGPTLLGKLLKEVRATTGFFEVQTGQSIGSLFLHLVTPSLAWVGQSISKALGTEPVAVDFKPWLESRGIKLSDAVLHDPNLRNMMGVFSLMLDHERPREA